MKLSFLILLFYLPFYATAQEAGRFIHINPSLNQESLELNKKYYVSSLDDSISFETLKFYIGHLAFFQEGERVGEVSEKYLLVDLENPESLRIPLPKEISNNATKMIFNLGVDSLTSVSGVFGGDLDPTNGMYWTWQSGYINIKLEGKADKCPARNHVFQFHMGGYQAPFNTMQKAELAISNTEIIQLNIELGHFLSQINVKENYQIMSPNERAVEAARYFISTFSISP